MQPATPQQEMEVEVQKWFSNARDGIPAVEGTGRLRAWFS